LRRRGAKLAKRRANRLQVDIVGDAAPEIAATLKPFLDPDLVTTGPSCERTVGLDLELVRRRHAGAQRAMRVKEPSMRKPGTSRIRLGRLTLIAAVLVVAMGSSALALQRARQSTTVAPGSFGAAVAECKTGRTAVSGGFAAPGFDPTNTGATVGRIGSKRVGKREIKTQAFNFGNDAGKLVSFAYCARRGHGLRVRSASTRVEPNTQGSAIAKCPRHTIAVGGGFGAGRRSSDQGPQVITLTSKRLGERRWKVVGINISSQMRTRSLVAYAYCRRAPFELVTRSKEVTVPAGALKTFKVRCPHGSRTFSGGFNGHLQLQDNPPRATAAVTSKRASAGRVWRTSAVNAFGPNPGSVSAYAYCRERRA
jgi:hypothetical protein